MKNSPINNCTMSDVLSLIARLNKKHNFRVSAKAEQLLSAINADYGDMEACFKFLHNYIQVCTNYAAVALGRSQSNPINTPMAFNPVVPVPDFVNKPASNASRVILGDIVYDLLQVLETKCLDCRGRCSRCNLPARKVLEYECAKELTDKVIEVCGNTIIEDLEADIRRVCNDVLLGHITAEEGHDTISLISLPYSFIPKTAFP